MNVTLMNQTARAAQAIRDAMDVTRGALDEPVDLEKDAKRFLMLAKLGHWSPFEHASFTFLIEGVSRVTQQQLTRHRMASFSIESQRHVRMSKDMENAFVVPATVAKRQMASVWDEAVTAAYMAYEKMIDAGVPMEDARYILPGATTGNILMTMNARELCHFFKLRMAPSAQWEIRELATTMFNRLHDLWPAIFNDEILRYAE